MFHDFKFALRMLAKSPGTTVVAVLALALGIGANAAIFSGVSAFLFRPLAVPQADQLARIFELTDDRGETDGFSYPDFADYREQSTSFDGLVAEDMVQAAISTQDQNDVIWGQVVSGNYFDALKLKPALGRSFAPDEDQTPGAKPVVVVSHSLWQRRLSADPNVIGRPIQLNNKNYTIIGVTPERFSGTKFGLVMDFWAPMAMVEELQREPGILKQRGSHWMNVFGRLKPGVTRTQAAAE